MLIARAGKNQFTAKTKTGSEKGTGLPPPIYSLLGLLLVWLSLCVSVRRLLLLLLRVRRAVRVVLLARVVVVLLRAAVQKPRCKGREKSLTNFKFISSCVFPVFRQSNRRESPPATARS